MTRELRKPNSTGKEIALSTVALVLVLALLEGAIRVTYAIRGALVDVMPLPYAMGADWGPVPPWIDQVRMLEPHPTLVWRGKPHFHQVYVDLFAPAANDAERRAQLRRFLPTPRGALPGAPVWTMSLNSEGFRDREFPHDKPDTTFRIVCLGDSWTAGSNVDLDQNYPRRLEALLAQRYPHGTFEAFNFGVFGYAAYNGRRLAPRAMALSPDLVVIGFAMNEAAMAGYRPAAAEEGPQSALEVAGALASRLTTSIEDHVELYRLLYYWAQLINWQPKTVADHMRERLEAFDWYDNMDEMEKEEWVHNSLVDYRRYLEEMIDLGRAAGAESILLYPEFWSGGPYIRTLANVAARQRLPLVDASRILTDAAETIERALEERFGLMPAGDYPGGPPGRTEIVFRLHQGSVVVPEALYISGTHPSLGELIPNRLALSDDGRGADERAGDGVWSLAAELESGAVVYYTYTNSGRAGEWEGLDVPATRRLHLPAEAAGRRVVAPIETFGQLYLHADPWHTNAEGNDLIARALLEAIEQTDTFKRYLARISPAKLSPGSRRTLTHALPPA